MDKIIGIMGGMGPQATINLYQQIVNLTPASVDQEHLHVIIDSYPQIPDRTQAILWGEENPTPYLIESATRLEQAGANCIIIPCNTAHAFIYDIQKALSIPILNMIEETTWYIYREYPSTTQVGLLASTGTLHVGIYQNSLSKFGFQCLIPTRENQSELVMKAIYEVKRANAGYLDKQIVAKLKAAARELLNQGADVVIAGCTEIPLVIGQKDLPIPLINPTHLIARKAVAFATEIP